jgi:membrane-bound ClpP family serine protease
MHIKRNLHNIDRLVRLVIGFGCLYVGFIDTSIIGNVLVSTIVGIFGIVNIFAAAFSYCPVYGLTGICTYRCKDEKDA